MNRARQRGSLAKNSFPIKLYPFALIYWFHALSPLSTAAAVSSNSNNNKISLQNPILKFSIFHFPFSILPFNFSAARQRFLLHLVEHFRSFWALRLSSYSADFLWRDRAREQVVESVWFWMQLRISRPSKGHANNQNQPLLKLQCADKKEEKRKKQKVKKVCPRTAMSTTATTTKMWTFFSQNCFMYSNINLVNLYFIWNF